MWTPLHARRLTVTHALLDAAVPFAKLDSLLLHALLDDGKLGSRTTVADYIPAVVKRELQLIASELGNCMASVTFDGVTRVAETIAVLMRFWWQAKQRPTQRLLCLDLRSRPVDASDLARVLTHHTIRHPLLGLDPNHVLAFIHDRASVNTAAVNLISFE